MSDTKPDSTIRERLDELYNELYGLAVHHLGLNDRVLPDSDYLNETARAVEVICQEIAREARLDELKSVRTQITGLRSHSSTDFTKEYDRANDEIANKVNRRIAELTQKPADWSCLACGAVNQLGGKDCYKCGASRDATPVNKETEDE